MEPEGSYVYVYKFKFSAITYDALYSTVILPSRVEVVSVSGVVNLITSFAFRMN